MVDLVTGDALAEGPSPALPGQLLRSELRVHVEPAEAIYRAPSRLHLVEDAPPEHLIAAADAERHRAPSAGAVEGPVEAAPPQPLEVGHGGLGAGQHHQVRVPYRCPVAHEAQAHGGLEGQCVEVGEVGDAGHHDHGHVEGGRRRRARQSRGGRTGPPAGEGQGVLGVEGHVVDPRQHADGGDTTTAFEVGQPSSEQGWVAPELVDHEGLDPRPQRGRKQLDGAVQRGEDTTPIDVAHHQGGEAGRVRHPQVDDVVVQEVDLGGIARSLGDHHVESAPQVSEAVEDGGEEPRLVVVVLGGGEMGQGPAEEDDLAGALPGGLEQDRVHRHLGLHLCGQGLHALSPADLVARRGDEGVEGHVLGLERRHLHASAGQQAAQARHHVALAHVAGGAAHHQPAAHAASSKAVCKRAKPLPSGTATRAWSGRPKDAQSLTTTPCGASRSRRRGARAHRT